MPFCALPSTTTGPAGEAATTTSTATNKPSSKEFADPTSTEMDSAELAAWTRSDRTDLTVTDCLDLSSSLAPPPRRRQSARFASNPEIRLQSTDDGNVEAMATTARREKFQHHQQQQRLSLRHSFSSARHLTFASARASLTRPFTAANNTRLQLTHHESAKQLGEAEQARARFSAAFADSITFVELGLEVPTFSLEEIKCGKFLGRGSFSTVEEIQCVRLAPVAVVAKEEEEEADGDAKKEDDDDDRNNKELQSHRQFVARHCTRESGDARYAVKRIRPSIMKDSRQTFWAATVDLVTEARFLANLEHPHVIKLRGVAAGDPFFGNGGEQNGENGNYFLVLDRLYETLTSRISDWKREQESALFLWRRFTKTGQIIWTDNFTERISRAYDLSAAFAYMHKQRLLHRDIKPENIGFDVRGDVKVFDLGLAREIPDEKDGTFQLTKMTGSLRYMAPEVAQGLPYNELCDVYSFTILLWEMLTCCRPFHQYRNQTCFVKAVHTKHNRPHVWRMWPKPIQSLIRKGWSHKLEVRHSMSDMESILSDELIKLRNGARPSSMDKTRRRSTVIYNTRGGGGGQPQQQQRQQQRRSGELQRSLRQMLQDWSSGEFSQQQISD